MNHRTLTMTNLLNLTHTTRFRSSPAPARRVVRSHLIRDYQPLYRHIGSRRGRFRRHSAGTMETLAARHRARPGDRRGLRRILATALSLAGVADRPQGIARGFGVESEEPPEGTRARCPASASQPPLPDAAGSDAKQGLLSDRRRIG